MKDARAGLKWIGVVIVIAVLAGALVVRRTPPPPKREPLPPVLAALPDASTPALPEGFRFVDVTAQQKITFEQHAVKSDPRYTDVVGKFTFGSGVAIADFDGDGFMDIFFVDAGPNTKNHLYLNRSGGGFEEVAEAWGISDTNQTGATLTPVVIDYDNDGKPDLYLARMRCSMLFHNTGTRFEDVSKKSGVGDCRNSQTALALDYDNDGKQDLYVIRYWRDLDYQHLSTTECFPENLGSARNGGRNTLYRNRGDGTFEDVTAKTGGGDTGWGWDGIFGDFAGDGVMRIHVANDWGSDALYAVKDGKLVDESTTKLEPERRSGMDSSIGDLTGDGKGYVFVSNIHVDEYTHKSNYLWRVNSDGPAENLAKKFGLEKCGWNWGAAFADFDLDGRQDLVVTAGMITGELPDEYKFSAATTAALPGYFSGDIKNWPSLGNRSHVGHQFTCVFSNQGDHFDEISPKVGITESWDGRAVGLIDFDNDGAEDVIITSRLGRPHLLHTVTNVQKKWVTFRLRGTTSNREGAGAVVKVTQGPRAWYRWAMGGHTGFGASSDPRLHFGIPDEGKVNVEIRWPSGQVQHLTDVPTGHHHTVVEGEGLLE